MEVSGVFSSCETLLTKSVFCRAKVNPALRFRTMSQLPTPMASTRTAMSRPSVSFAVRAACELRGIHE